MVKLTDKSQFITVFAVLAYGKHGSAMKVLKP